MIFCQKSPQDSLFNYTISYIGGSIPHEFLKQVQWGAHSLAFG